MNLTLPPGIKALPDHTQLPFSDGAVVENFHEHPQSLLLTDSIRPVMRRLHPDGQYAIGQNSAIYYRLTDPPLRGSVAPDWYYVPGAPPMLDGQLRRSYVLWQELIAPLIVLEFSSGDGSEERDATPNEGKFWVYERAIRLPYYGIYSGFEGTLELHRLIDGTYQSVTPNERGHFPVPPLGLELGLWQGVYVEATAPWLRWWDDRGRMLLTGWEEVEEEKRRAQQEHERAERLADRLRALGVDPDQP
jgi:Uma2 family endonuclease